MKKVSIAAGLLMLAQAGTSIAQQSPIERGKYLVEGVVACGNCHIARDKGVPQFDRGLCEQPAAGSSERPCGGGQRLRR